MKTKVFWDLCEGNGVCVAAAPKIFDIDDDDNLIVLDENPPEEQRAALQAAVRICPKRALAIED
ncbi:ferredoxin [Curtobacterium sp. VKM Ac-2887]|uniref:ferredoxin n=1 Tax=Curtobacterium sp. VKM Ac-2887 TaxID=2783819 RepID=UPI00188D09E7|nr:ferredoxin [Curtobacterium sp. VKM Ac-2887]MBF4585684.1 ferredoxin [Curtobacterium sp. VKM Ac-2887]